MSILDKIPSLVGNELFQKLAAIEDITALCKEDQEKYCLFLQQIKRKNDGKGKYKLISNFS